MIQVKSRLQKLEKFVDAHHAYLKLRKVLREDQLFLLESLSGPKADNSKILVGFNPIVSFVLSGKKLKIIGNDFLKNIFNQLINEKLNIDLSDDCYKLESKKQFLMILRLVESIFHIDYLGTHRGFQFGFFGMFDTQSLNNCFDYENESSVPNIYLSIYQGMIYSDLVSGSTSLIVNQIEGVECYSRASIEALLLSDEKIEINENKNLNQLKSSSLDDESLNKTNFLAQFNTAIKEIENGCFYQVAINEPVSVSSERQPFSVYQNLRKITPAPYMYYACFNGLSVIGASLGLFINIENNEISMRPASWQFKALDNHQDELDYLQRQHLLLVDLCQNDLAKVVEHKSLKLENDFKKEAYEEIISLVSEIKGEKAQHLDKYDVLYAVMPPQALSSAPKNKQNNHAAIGFIDFRGTMQLALAVREIHHQDNQYQADLVSMVISDSNSEYLYEQREALLKPIMTSIRSPGEEK